MRIGIDARFFGPQETGIGRYVDRLIRHLEQIDRTNTYIVFLRQAAFHRWQPAAPERWEKVLADYHWYTVSEQRYMPAIFRRAKLDILHVPHFNVPMLYRGRFIVTIHDLILDQFPTERATTLGPIMFRAKFAAYQFVVRHAVRAAAHIITVSEHSKKDLVSRFGVSPKKISVTYESVDQLPEPITIDGLRIRGVQPPYLLHVGNSYPHKNLERLIDAWQELQTRRPGGQLVLVGKRDYFSKRLEAYAREKKAPHVVWFGFASEPELAALYQQANAYIFPSLSEGFGLPGLEAMYAGTPVYAAQASCLPEIFGPAAAYFDPHDQHAMAASMERALYDTLEHQRLIAAGTARLQQFSWERMARQTLDIYQRLNDRRSNSN